MSQPPASPPTAASVTPSHPPFAFAPPPWTTKCDIHWIISYNRPPLSEHAYAPLEKAYPNFSDPTKAGAFTGGLGLIMIIRYSETPVGSYNEMVYIPGNFDVPGQNAKTSRVTTIYVDQKNTAYNGRLFWNIPKHLARFEFTTLENPTRTTVRIFPHDPAITTPFFTATMKPFRWTPAFPFSSKPLITQPPVPANKEDGKEEECGTDKWARVLTYLNCKKAKLCWIDVEQPTVEEAASAGAKFPRIKPFKVGLSLPASTFSLDPAEFF